MKGYTERKRKVMSSLIGEIPEGMNKSDAYDLASRVIDLYIETYNVRKCKNSECDNYVSTANKTGVCRNCYLREYRKKDEQKRLAMLRARYSRKLVRERKLNVQQ